jgi:phosphatidylserine decarboxylase
MKEIFIIFLILLLFFIFFWSYFHREPRLIPQSIENEIILSPAYGTIYEIIEEDEKIHIVIILNLFDIHTQYYPINGKVINQIYDVNGKFELVYELFKSRMNEKIITTIQPNLNISLIIVQQIAGMFVRRIETTLINLPEQIKAGEKMGRIKFGSRVDLILPKENLILNISKGDKVYGPNTFIGKYSNRDQF